MKKILGLYCLLILSFLCTAQSVTITTPSIDTLTILQGQITDIVADVVISSGITNTRMFVNGSTASSDGGASTIAGVGTTQTVSFLASQYSALRNLNVGLNKIRVQARSGGTGYEDTVYVNVVTSLGGGGGISTLDRETDAVLVLKGDELKNTISNPTGQIIAYKFTTTWVQIPVQIDEIVVKPINAPYNGYTDINGGSNCTGQTVPNKADAWLVPFYADANTFTGADTDLAFDADDELVLRYSDAGNEANGTLPSGVDRLLEKLQVTDPLSGQKKFIYLFLDTTSPNPSAGITDNITYSFGFKPDAIDPTFLGAADYKANYDICNYGSSVQNVENSTVTTPYYQLGYANRVAEEVLQISVNGTLKPDILDRYEASNFNNRSTYEYETSKGVFICNKDGYLRSIRSIMGTSSGVYNELTYFYYPTYVERKNNFRVHGGGNAELWSFADYNSAISGATYSRSTAKAGVTIDGIIDGIGIGTPQTWDFIDSDLGDVVTLYHSELGNGASVTFNSYYEDDASVVKSSIPTTGLYGAHGTKLRSSNCFDLAYPNDLCGSYTAATLPTMLLARYDYYKDTTAVQADAEALRQFYDNPLLVESVTAIGEGLANSVQITSPTQTLFSVGTTLEVDAIGASDNNFTQINIYVGYNGGVPVLNQSIPATGTTFETTFFPQSLANPNNDLSNMQAGGYRIIVEGVTTPSVLRDTINVTVAANQNPVVSVSGVTNNATYTPTQILTASVTATDADGTITKVELFIDGSLYATDAQSPYSFTISGLTETTHTLLFRATDNELGIGEQTLNIIISDGQANSQFRIATATETLNQIVPDWDGKGGYIFRVKPDYTGVELIPPPAGTVGGNGILDAGNTGIQQVYTDELDLFKPFRITSDNTQYFQDANNLSITSQFGEIGLVGRAYMNYSNSNLSLTNNSFELTTNSGNGARGFSVTGDNLKLVTTNSQLSNVANFVLTADANENADYISPNSLQVLNPITNTTTSLQVALQNLNNGAGNGIFNADNNNDTIRVSNIFQKDDFTIDALGNNLLFTKLQTNGSASDFELGTNKIFLGSYQGAATAYLQILNSPYSFTFGYNDGISANYLFRGNSSGVFTENGSTRIGIDNTGAIVVKTSTTPVPGYVLKAIDNTGRVAWLPDLEGGGGGANDGYIQTVALNGTNNLSFTGVSSGFTGIIDMANFKNDITGFSVTGGNLVINQANGNSDQINVKTIAPVQDLLNVPNQTVISENNGIWTIGVADDVDVVEQVLSSNQTEVSLGSLIVPLNSSRMQVYRNGVLLDYITDYNANSGENRIFLENIGIDAGDLLIIYIRKR